VPGYGDVYEATVTAGPLKGARAVAKRACKRPGNIYFLFLIFSQVSAPGHSPPKSQFIKYLREFTAARRA